MCVSHHREGVELSAYMRQEGYSIIPISCEHQLAYACNVLNLGDSRIISVHTGSARQIVKSPHFKVRERDRVQHGARVCSVQSVSW